MSEIIFRDVHKRYAGATADTIRKVDLRIQRGEFVVFVGPSGCGKSTLLRMVAGLEDITSGDLNISGKRVNEVPPSRRGVAMVFQSYALYPHMNVYDNMAFGLKQAKMAENTVDQRVRKAAKILQLDALLERLPKQLSGGQRQRVAIGRAIVREPEVFLFDEPLSNLDAALRVQTRLEIAKLHSDIGTASMIYVTHDQVEAMTLADKIVLLNAGEAVMRDGSVAQFGAPLELYHHPVNKFVAGFIGSPKMNFVAAKMVRSDGHTALAKVADAEFLCEVDAAKVAPGSDVTLGVRPEHVRFCDAGTPNSIAGLVAFIELLGEASYIYVRLAGGEMVTVRQSGQTKFAVNDPVNVNFPEDCLHLFDDQDHACRRTTDPEVLGRAHVAGVTISQAGTTSQPAAARPH